MLKKCSRKHMFSIVLCCIIFVCIISLISVGANIISDDGNLKEEYNVLLLGIDSVGCNTDVIAIANYKVTDNRLSIIQIPRDTYFEANNEADSNVKKINQIYAYYLERYKSKDIALNNFCEDIRSCFGIKIDHYMLATLDGLSKFIDSIGGITIDVPFSMKYEDPAQDLSILLEQGPTTLSGEECLQFIRFRSSYIEGDIGRVDAQKIFLAALYDKLLEGTSAKTSLDTIKNLISCIYTDISVVNAMKIFTDIKNDFSKSDVLFVTIPGEATRWNVNDGIWYYVVNRSAAVDLLCNELSISMLDDKEFDMSRVLSTDEKDNINNIYESNSIDFKIYSKEDVNNIKIYIKPS